MVHTAIPCSLFLEACAKIPDRPVLQEKVWFPKDGFATAALPCDRCSREKGNKRLEGALNISGTVSLGWQEGLHFMNPQRLVRTLLEGKTGGRKSC